MSHDILIKRLLTDGKSVFLRRLLGSQRLQEWPTELLTPPLRADLILKSRFAVHHIEFQSTNERRMNWRMLRYYDAIFKRLSARQSVSPIDQTVVYIGERPMSMPSGIKQQRLEFSYKLLDIRTFGGMREALLDSPTPEDWVVACLCSEHTGDSVWRIVYERIFRLSGDVRADLFGKYALACALRPVPDDLANEVKKMVIRLEQGQSPFLDNIYMNGSRAQAESTIHKFLKNKGLDHSLLDATLNDADLERLNVIISMLIDGVEPEDMLRPRDPTM